MVPELLLSICKYVLINYPLCISIVSRSNLEKKRLPLLHHSFHLIDLPICALRSAVVVCTCLCSCTRESCCCCVCEKNRRKRESDSLFSLFYCHLNCQDTGMQGKNGKPSTENQGGKYCCRNNNYRISYCPCSNLRTR